MSEKFFASTADPNVQSNSYPPGFVAFQKDLLSHFLRLLLSLFYSEAEIMVGSFLVETMERAAYTDQQLAEALGLTQKQVRAALESRLMKDYVVESEQVNGSGSVWYRISPNVVIATEYRANHLFKRLSSELKAAKETELYLCPICQREYDLLRVISVANFRCEICPVDTELIAQDSRAMKAEVEAKLAELKNTIRPLLEALGQVRKMYVPRPPVVRKTLIREQEQLSIKRENLILERQQNTQGLSSSQTSNPLAKLETGWKPAAATAMKTSREAPEWLLLQQNSVVAPSASRHAKAEFPEMEPYPSPGASDIDLRVTAERLAQQTRKKETHIVDLLLCQPKPEIIQSSQNVKKEEREEESMVRVRGILVPLSEVRVSEERYIEQMTEDEFFKYDALVLSLTVKTKTQ